MKKLLSLITIFAITVYSYASDTTTVQKTVNQVTQSVSDAKNGISDAIKSVVPDSASLGFSKVYEDIKNGISALAISLKVGATDVYHILVKQQVVYAFIFIILGIIGLVFLVVGLIMFQKSDSDDWDVPTVNNISIVLFWLLGLVGIIVSISHIDIIMTGFINPEYGAIKDIISFVK